MNKLLSILMCMLLALGFASCSSDIDENDGGKKTPELKITAIIKQDPSQKMYFAEENNTLMPTWVLNDKIYAIWKEGGEIKQSRFTVSEINDGVATFVKSQESFPTPPEGTKVHFVFNGSYSHGDFIFDNNNEVLINFCSNNNIVNNTFQEGVGMIPGSTQYLGTLVVMFASATVTHGELFLAFENQMSVVCVNKFSGLKESTAFNYFSFNSPTRATVRYENDELTFTTDESSYTDIISQKAITTNEQGETTNPIYFVVPPQKAGAHTFYVVNSRTDETYLGKTYRRLSFSGTLSSAPEIRKGKFIYIENKRMSFSPTKGVYPVKGPLWYNQTNANYRRSCRWVQLKQGGPLWAEFNVGSGIDSYADIDVEKFKEERDRMQTSRTPSPYLFNIWGGHYTFNGLDEYTYNSANPAINDNKTNGTASRLFGWRTPTQGELINLISDEHTWTYYETGAPNNPYIIAGWEVRGKGDYSQNSIFLPLAGNSDQNYGNGGAGKPIYLNEGQKPINGGSYWSNNTGGSGAYVLKLGRESKPTTVDSHNTPHGCSVRAVL